MKKILAAISIVIILGLTYLFINNDKYLRGSVEKSSDGKTYLIIADDNGGGCGPIIIDGEKWSYGINEAGPISPGIHKIECGGEIEFEIPAGTIFRFDYWGP